MRLVSSALGSVALHVSGDDVLPENGLVVADLIAILRNTYGFSSYPAIPPGMAGLLFAGQPLVFQEGTFADGDAKYPFTQLSVLPNGDVVTAQNTDLAERILDDYMHTLDEKLGYKFAPSRKFLTYVSNLVVEFDPALENRLSVLGRLSKFLEDRIGKPDGFKLKRLAFGSGNVTAVPVISLEMFDSSDFLIERRTGSAYSENRYFCSAPLRTADHIKVLEDLETLFSLDES